MQVGVEVQPKPYAHEVLHEMTGRHPADVPLPGELHDEEGRRPPGRGKLVLVEMAVVEWAEPPRGLPAEAAFGRELALQSVAVEVVVSDRDGDAVCDLERLDQTLARGHDVEFEPVAALEAPV